MPSTGHASRAVDGAGFAGMGFVGFVGGGLAGAGCAELAGVGATAAGNDSDGDGTNSTCPTRMSLGERRPLTSTISAVTPLADVAYDAGGNHRNDYFSFTLEGVRYMYNHSSFGFGFRVCQPVDCIVREADGVVTDGCQPERTLPEACIAVSAPLPELVDNFAVCAGDPES
jgi:hypothetical protein